MVAIESDVEKKPVLLELDNGLPSSIEAIRQAIAGYFVDRGIIPENRKGDALAILSHERPRTLAILAENIILGEKLKAPRHKF